MTTYYGYQVLRPYFSSNFPHSDLYYEEYDDALKRMHELASELEVSDIGTGTVSIIKHQPGGAEVISIARYRKGGVRPIDLQYARKYVSK